LELTAKHRETLAELINIGYGRAAAALSQLTGEKIKLEAPKVEVLSIDHVTDVLQNLLQGDISSVHQIFSGPVGGHALLLLDAEAADLLTSVVMGEDAVSGNKRTARREALTEVGNIVLQASLGICGDLLQVHVSFSVPVLHVDTVDDILHSVTVEQRELQFALLVRTRFELLRSQVSGYLLVVLGVTSFSKLLDELDKWERRELSP
jgi:chemotaxis protein CheC